MNRFLRLIGRRHPTYFIGIPGILMLVSGLAVGVLATLRILNVHVVPLGTTLASVSLCMAGAMCVFTSIVLNTVGKLDQEIKSRWLLPVGGSASSGRKGANWVVLVFGLTGVAALLTGMLWGAWAVYRMFMGGGLLSGSYVGSVSTCLAGLLTLLTGIVVHAVQGVLLDVKGAG